MNKILLLLSNPDKLIYEIPSCEIYNFEYYCKHRKLSKIVTKYGKLTYGHNIPDGANVAKIFNELVIEICISSDIDQFNFMRKNFPSRVNFGIILENLYIFSDNDFIKFILDRTDKKYFTHKNTLNVCAKCDAKVVELYLHYIDLSQYNFFELISIAINNKNSEAAEYLFDRNEINYNNIYQFISLFKLACHNDDYEMAKSIIRRKPDINYESIINNLLSVPKIIREELINLSKYVSHVKSARVI